ncbi:proline--tRNA ligase [Sporosarcina pasteurii]|uniref:Proline--tRNA ligase n=1 Tax=Sporosarcina pasteurii TaxID=1474 RepID=A0A380BII3_SPOPA|nr:proline--tRNA ligase [Sporosarcina pasteurii]MDS9470617.1 proline--tRNA ligase [Sporosarcina pasteurii]QBQ05696.1 proline--tRNA ligase [Sporosarcina pasteurii]SUJ01186.1 Proline--tRNA ligase [Sporosarcina pasteurii]
MKQSQAFIPTLRENPTDVETTSHQLLLRAGFLRRHTSGVYSYLPFGLKVLRKIEAIIREEMEAIGAVEMATPTLQTSELLQERIGIAEDDSNLFHLEDERNRTYILGALHTEQVTSLIRDEVKSYKQLPLTLYQMITKFQDEPRPRFGLLVNREFVKQEAYSFHVSDESFHETYEQMKEAYSTIFTKLNLACYAVDLASSPQDSLVAYQFVAKANDGDEKIAYSSTGSFAESVEQAAVSNHYEKSDEILQEIEKVETPKKRTIQEVADFLEVPIEKCIKTLIYKVDDEIVAVISRGDHKINEIKLKNAIAAHSVTLAEENTVKALLSCESGSIGPVQLPVGVKIIADFAVASIVNGVAGANEDDFHLLNVNPEKDFAVNEYADLRYAEEGDIAPDGIGTIKFTKGFEVGRLDALGIAYSGPMNATFIDEAGTDKPMIMGRYGMNVSRIMAVIAEQYNDEFGLKWPKNLSPFDIHLVPINLNDASQKELADNLYKLLQTYRFEVLYDDRTERAGVKFADADLIGLPIRITIGKKAKDGILEVKFRETGEMTEWQVEEVTEKLQAFFTMD